MKILLPELCLWTRKNWLNFRRHLLLHQDLGFKKRRLQLCEVWYSSTVWLISLQNWLGFHENLIVDVALYKEVPINCWKSSGSRWAGFTSAEVSTFQNPDDPLFSCNCVLYLLIFCTTACRLWLLPFYLASNCNCVACYHLTMLSKVQRPTKHIIGNIGDGFYGSNDLTNSVKALKEGPKD